MNQSTNHLSTVLKRNNFELRYEHDKKLILVQSSKVSPLIRKYYIVTIIMVAFGLIVMKVLSALFGAILLSMSYPIYSRAGKLKSKGKEGGARTISIEKDAIEISNGDKGGSAKISTADIVEYALKFERDDNLPTGKIVIKNTAGEETDLIEFFGEDRNYIEEDLRVLLKEIDRITKG